MLNHSCIRSHLAPLKKATVYTQVFKHAKGLYTGPPGPPILGGNNPSSWISPPRIGGLGGLMQGFNVFRTCVYTIALKRGEFDHSPPFYGGFRGIHESSRHVQNFSDILLTLLYSFRISPSIIHILCHPIFRSSMDVASSEKTR
jgi:hypothetical protein